MSKIIEREGIVTINLNTTFSEKDKRDLRKKTKETHRDLIGSLIEQRKNTYGPTCSLEQQKNQIEEEIKNL